MNRITALARSFLHAGHGIAAALRKERNLRIHLCAVSFVVIFGIWQDLSATHWSIQLLCCALVIALEAINSALETICDSFSTELHPSIRYAKDVSAGSVLVCAVSAAIIWFVILFSTDQYLYNLQTSFEHSARPLFILAVWAVCAILLVFGPINTKDDNR